MRYIKIKDLMPTIEKQMNLPPDRARDLKRRVRAASIANDAALEFYTKLMEDAQIDQDEAWDECAQLMGFKDLDDLHGQGFGMSLNGNQLQLRPLSDEVKGQ